MLKNLNFCFKRFNKKIKETNNFIPFNNSINFNFVVKLETAKKSKIKNLNFNAFIL